MQAWGLIVLLISKTAGHSADIPAIEQDKAAGVLHSQRALAEVTEMIRTSHLVHKGLVNMDSINDSNINDMTFGNKIALLSGDYLLANSSKELANLKNQELVEQMSSAVRDLAEAEFIGPRDKQNNPLPSKPKNQKIDDSVLKDEFGSAPLSVQECLGNTRTEWTLRNVLSAGNIIIFQKII